MQQARQKSEGSSGSVTDNNNSSGSSIFTFKMGGDDEIMENSKSSSKSNSIERQQQHHNNGSDLKRYLKNFMLFSNLEIESEKRCRDEQLSKIVKALMLFEKKLQKEQEIIQQQLCEKDRVINRQMHTISNMKEKLKLGGENNVVSDDAISLEDAAEFCPMCRKKYYLRAFKSMATQTNLNGFTNNISDGEFIFSCALVRGLQLDSNGWTFNALKISNPLRSETLNVQPLDQFIQQLFPI
jgi:hypothetical protein